MPGWIIAAGLGSIALTALLTFVLWRLNAPANERAAQRENGEGAGFPVVAGGDYGSDGTSDGGGGK